MTASTKTHLGGFGEAAAGAASLRFMARSPTDPRRHVFELQLQAEPWHQTGMRPYLWDLLPPQEERSYPVLRLVLSREARVKTRYAGKFEDGTMNPQRSLPDDGDLKPFAGRAFVRGETPGDRLIEVPAHYGRYALHEAEGSMRIRALPGSLSNSMTAALTLAPSGEISRLRLPMLSPALPMLQIIRPQRPSVIANPAGTIRNSNLLQPPYVSRPALSISNDTKRSNRSVRVAETPVGVEFQQTSGKYRVEVRIRNPLEPAAFCYQVVDPEASERNDFGLYVVHCKNVQVTAQVGTRHDIDKLTVGAVQVPFNQVPGQGADLVLDHPALVDAMKMVRPGTGSARKGAAIDLADMLLGSLPIIGDFYDLGQLAYGAATGEDFWGRKAGPAELALLGGALLLPFALKRAL